MLNAFNQFKANVQRAKELGMLANAIQPAVGAAVDLSDLFRAQLVLAVSALDHFIHEVARIGMIQACNGQRGKTDAYLRLPLPLSVTDAALTGQPADVWLGEAVREKHSWLSFQQPDKIADAIRLISQIELWSAVGTGLALPAQDVKTQLTIVVDRRNKIAHEADMDPANPGFRWPIDKPLADDATNFVERIGEAIYNLVV